MGPTYKAAAFSVRLLLVCGPVRLFAGSVFVACRSPSCWLPCCSLSRLLSGAWAAFLERWLLTYRVRPGQLIKSAGLLDVAVLMFQGWAHCCFKTPSLGWILDHAV